MLGNGLGTHTVWMLVMNLRLGLRLTVARDSGLVFWVRIMRYAQIS